MNLNYVKEKRLEKGYSLQKIVNYLGILDKVKYYRRESGAVHFKPEELRLVAELLELSPERLFIKVVSEIEIKLPEGSVPSE